MSDLDRRHRRSSTLDSIKWTFSDGWTLVRRNLTQLRHAPSEIFAVMVFPIFAILLFGFVFGSAIPVPGGGNYREYLIPGLFAMSSTAAMMASMQRVAADNGQGVMDRYRSMPMARSAVPFGQTGADLIVAAFNYGMMTVCGLAVGWRMHNGVVNALIAFALLLLFGYSLSWFGVFIGLTMRSQEMASRIGPVFLLITMVSNAFVPTAGMPTWLRTFADWSPVSAVTVATRKLFGNPGVPVGGPWPMQYPILASLAWGVLLLLIFVPLSVYRYQRFGRR